MDDTGKKDTEGLEVHFHGTSEHDTHAALTTAIEVAAAEFIGLPDMVIMNTWRRLELPAKEWHTFTYGVVPIELRSPHDLDVPEQVRGTACPWSLFICIRRTPIQAKQEQEHDDTTA